MASILTETQELKTVPFVDLEKYSGLWYEIASIPSRFQKNCTHTTANYTLTDKGYVKVVNRCYKNNFNGRVAQITGRAFAEKNSGNSKLRVQFFWPFSAAYWIIDLDDDYTYAVVSEPQKERLWILSRSPQMQEITYEQIKDRVEKMGINTSLLVRTIQDVGYPSAEEIRDGNPYKKAI
ncbi:MAG: lipocalin family protein [Bacteroidetes bacterium]|nr:lipocalin family protein [Bacteroidota bacterium]